MFWIDTVSEKYLKLILPRLIINLESNISSGSESFVIHNQWSRAVYRFGISVTVISWERLAGSTVCDKISRSGHFILIWKSSVRIRNLYEIEPRKTLHHPAINLKSSTLDFLVSMYLWYCVFTFQYNNIKSLWLVKAYEVLLIWVILHTNSDVCYTSCTFIQIPFTVFCIVLNVVFSSNFEVHPTTVQSHIKPPLSKNWLEFKKLKSDVLKLRVNWFKYFEF